MVYMLVLVCMIRGRILCCVIFMSSGCRKILSLGSWKYIVRLGMCVLVLHHCLVQQSEGGKNHPCTEASAPTIGHQKCTPKKNTCSASSKRCRYMCPREDLEWAVLIRLSKPPSVNFIWMSKCGFYAESWCNFWWFFPLCYYGHWPTLWMELPRSEQISHK